MAAASAIEGIRAASPDMPAGALSGGNQQKLLLAKTMLTEPRIVIIDEPTRGIDVGTKRQIYAFIRRLAEEGRTMIVGTHEMNFARDVANRVVFLDQGVIAEQGCPREVLSRPKTERLQGFLAAQAA